MPDRGGYRLADLARCRHSAPIQSLMGRRKRTNGRKRHIAVDVTGLLPAVVVTAAPIQDRDAAFRLPMRLSDAFSTIRLVWDDGGYSGRLIGWAKQVVALGIQVIKRIPGGTGLPDERRDGGRHCHVVERGKLGECGVTSPMPAYKGHRYPVEIINHCVWLYFRFPLSFREVEEMMLERGVVVSYETIRRWCAKFGQAYANELCRRRSRPGEKWHLDEVFIKINGKLYYLWRAVDQDGNVLDVLVQSRRNALAAKKFFRKLLQGLRYVPRVIVTDKLGSYRVAHRELIGSVEHRRSKYLNNRAENSHQPTRQRERAMKRFTSPGHAQRFLSTFSGISPHFRPKRHKLSAPEWRTEMADRFAVWQQVTAADAAA